MSMVYMAHTEMANGTRELSFFAQEANQTM